MLTDRHKEIAGKIWEIANRLRGPYRPPQYRLVMLPMVVLRRLDWVLEPTKDAVLAEHARLLAANTPGNAIPRLLTRMVDKDRKQPLYNTSPFTFAKLLGDSENIAPNLVSYINGFSDTARAIFDKFKFGDQIEKLDSSNRLYAIVQAMADPRVDLHPDRISNLEMGYLFEHLVMKFNEQANEEAGDHITPREVIRLMTHLVYTGEEDVYKPGIYREIYDPACGTGGMLSVSEETIRAQNERAQLGLYGQEYNDESWAICCSDMLIKDEETDHIVLGDTLGDGKTHDGFQGRQFHYMLANPPFGVEWKDQQKVVGKEAEELGFGGRFGAGLPAINDGSLLFLQHMISKMKPSPEQGGEGSKIAIIFDGSPLFSGDAGSGPSNIRRWIIENDWLDAIVALPDQLFYNTGIFTYIWLVTNRQKPERRGKVQLIDGTRFYQKMKKSLNNKRNELDDVKHIARLTEIYGNFTDGERETVTVDGQSESRVVSRIFENREFGFLKVTVERPLRLNLEATPERIARLDQQSAFVNLAVSKKRKDAKAAEAEEAAGREEQQRIRDICSTLEKNGRYMDREVFEADLDRAAKRFGAKLPSPIKKAIFAALSERDPKAERCIDRIWEDGKGEEDRMAGRFADQAKPDRVIRYEADSELRDTENIPLPAGTALPLPMNFGPDMPNDDLVAAMRPAIDAYVTAEVLPHVSDAWVDYAKTKVGYEIPINRHFYVYKPPRPLDAIEADIAALEGEIAGLLKGLVA
ncbi:type I restriction-modification system subunit M [Sphingomonas citri]